LPGLPTK